MTITTWRFAAIPRRRLLRRCLGARAWTCLKRCARSWAWISCHQDCVRGGRNTEPEVGALPMPDRRAADLPPDHGVATRGAHQSGDALPGDEVGLADSIRESGGLAERSAAGGRDDQFAD